MRASLSSFLINNSANIVLFFINQKGLFIDPLFLEIPLKN